MNVTSLQWLREHPGLFFPSSIFSFLPQWHRPHPGVLHGRRPLRLPHHGSARGPGRPGHSQHAPKEEPRTWCTFPTFRNWSPDASAMGNCPKIPLYHFVDCAQEFSGPEGCMDFQGSKDPTHRQLTPLSNPGSGPCATFKRLPAWLYKGPQGPENPTQKLGCSQFQDTQGLGWFQSQQRSSRKRLKTYLLALSPPSPKNARPRGVCHIRLRNQVPVMNLLVMPSQQHVIYD